MGNSQGAESDGHACLHCMGRFFLACSPSRSLLQPKGTSLAALTNDTDDREHRTDQRTGHLDSKEELQAWTQRIQTSELAVQQCLQRMLGGNTHRNTEDKSSILNMNP